MPGTIDSRWHSLLHLRGSMTAWPSLYSWRPSATARRRWYSAVPSLQDHKALRSLALSPSWPTWQKMEANMSHLDPLHTPHRDDVLYSPNSLSFILQIDSTLTGLWDIIVNHLKQKTGTFEAVTGFILVQSYSALAALRVQSLSYINSSHPHFFCAHVFAWGEGV